MFKNMFKNMFNIDPMSNEFIFRQLIKTKKSYKLACNNKPASYSTFRDHLRKSLRGFVSDPQVYGCLLYTSPSPRDQRGSRMPSSA